ncbi:hypothetical protein STEG23_015873 [Scotinomys teguina]
MGGRGTGQSEAAGREDVELPVVKSFAFELAALRTPGVWKDKELYPVSPVSLVEQPCRTLSLRTLGRAHKRCGLRLDTVEWLRPRTEEDQSLRPDLASKAERLVPPSGLWRSDCPNGDQQGDSVPFQMVVVAAFEATEGPTVAMLQGEAVHSGLDLSACVIMQRDQSVIMSVQDRAWYLGDAQCKQQ